MYTHKTRMTPRAHQKGKFAECSRESHVVWKRDKIIDGTPDDGCMVWSPGSEHFSMAPVKIVLRRQCARSCVSALVSLQATCHYTPRYGSGMAILTWGFAMDSSTTLCASLRRKRRRATCPERSPRPRFSAMCLGPDPSSASGESSFVPGRRKGSAELTDTRSLC